MRWAYVAGVCVLAAALGSAAPPVELPKEVTGDVGDFVPLRAKTAGKVVHFVPLDPGLKLFPADLLTDKKATVVSAAKPGRYRVLAYSSVKDDPTEPAIVTVVIGGVAPVEPDVAPPPKPKPDPKPPQPKPGDGLRVLVLFESDALSKLPAPQLGAIYSKTVRDYLNAKCPVGPDGKTREWRMWDADVDASGEAKVWQDALGRPRKSLPWVVITHSKGEYEGPLPASADAFLTLLKQHGGE